MQSAIAAKAKRGQSHPALQIALGYNKPVTTQQQLRTSEHAVSGAGTNRGQAGRSLRRNGCHRTVEKPTLGLCVDIEKRSRGLGVRYCALESFDAAWAATARFVQDIADKPGTLARLPEKSVAFN